MYWINNSNETHGSSKQVPFMCDTLADISNLPTSQASGVQQGEDTASCLPCAKGSSCFCIGESSLFMLNSSDVWTEV